jgi:capsular polysaccharide transport system permease protein
MKLLGSATFWLFFVIPMALGTTYYLKYASDQYEATAHFTIEKHGKLQSDPLGALTGLAGNVSSTRDALIIKDFIESREVIERTRDDFDIKKLYARSDKDWLSRLEDDASIEDIIEYWQNKVSVQFDSTSGIVNLSVMAFEPKDAVLVIKAVLKESEQLVNNLSEKSRQDSLSFARRELKNAEANLKKARTLVSKFRDSEKALSPEKNVETKLNLVASLELELANAETVLRSLRIAMKDNSPKVKTARNKVFSLKRQVQKERARSILNSGNNAKTMSTIISKYEELLTEQGFAEKSYEAALLNIEQARLDATQQHRYLTVIVQPKLPEEPLKPKQPNDFIVLLLASLLLWGILSLIIASIRDHAGWI